MRRRSRKTPLLKQFRPVTGEPEATLGQVCRFLRSAVGAVETGTHQVANDCGGLPLRFQRENGQTRR